MASVNAPIRNDSTQRRVHESICNGITSRTRVVLDTENIFINPPATMPERFSRPHFNLRIDSLSKSGFRGLPAYNLRFIVQVGMRFDMRSDRIYAERDLFQARDDIAAWFELDRGKSLNGRDLELIRMTSPVRRNDLILHELEYECIIFIPANER
jgi:hypothetical protein